MWDFFTGLYNNIIGFFNSIWKWFADSIVVFVQFIYDLFFYSLDWFLYFCKLGFFYFYKILDWLVTTSIAIFTWFLNLLPDVVLPATYIGAFKQFLGVLSTVNDFVPVVEAVSLLLIYLSFILLVIVYRQIRNWY